MTSALIPAVKWSQRSKYINLKFDICQAKDVDINFLETKLSFKCKGVQKGMDKLVKTFFLEIDLLDRISPEMSSFIVHPQYVDVMCIKIEKSYWSRLNSTKNKPSWLSVDWSNYLDEEEEEEEIKNKLKLEKEQQENEEKQQQNQNQNQSIIEPPEIYLDESGAIKPEDMELIKRRQQELMMQKGSDDNMFELD